MSALEDRCIEIDMQINDLQLSIEDRDAVQKKLDKHEPDKSKHLKIMTAMSNHYSSVD